MERASAVLLGIFFVLSIIQAWAIASKRKKLRRVTKLMLMPALLGYYLLATWPSPHSLFIGMLIFNWFGDYFLLKTGSNWLAAGGLCFGGGHICLFFFCLGNTNFTAWRLEQFILLLAVVTTFAVALFFVIKNMRRFVPRKLNKLASTYIISNGVVNCSAFAFLISSPCFATALLVCGAVFFFVSDVILFSVRFNTKGLFKTSFVVMITYCIAFCLITTAGALI